MAATNYNGHGLEQAIRNLTERADQVVQKVAHDIEGGAKQRAPVDTGHLRNSIQAQRTGDAEAEVTVGAEYAGYVEYGTRHMAAQPYLTPAAEEQREPFEQAMRQLVE